MKYYELPPRHSHMDSTFLNPIHPVTAIAYIKFDSQTIAGAVAPTLKNALSPLVNIVKSNIMLDYSVYFDHALLSKTSSLIIMRINYTDNVGFSLGFRFTQEEFSALQSAMRNDYLFIAPSRRAILQCQFQELLPLAGDIRESLRKMLELWQQERDALTILLSHLNYTAS